MASLQWKLMSCFFPMAKMPCMSMFSDIISPPTYKEIPKQREIAFTMTSYHIGAVAETSYIHGTTAFAGKVYMLAAGFRKEKLLIVGLQEARSKEGGTSQIVD